MSTTAAAQDGPAAAGARPGRIRRVPAIDGLRGLAVAAVVAYHFFPPALPGGYLGVDVFFVLSGFLITSLLIREHATTARIDLPRFWLRRVRRILPAAVLVLVAGTAAAGAVGGDPAVGLGLQFAGTLAFVNNWTQIASAQSYFADQGVQVFAHYWSLAVEEQFYILWPPLVAGGYLLLRRRSGRGRRRVDRPDGRFGRAPVALALAGAAASAAWMARLHLPGEDPTRVYYGTDTHAFGLLLGAALAFALTTGAPSPVADSWPHDRGPLRGRAAAAVAGVAGLGVLAALFALLEDTADITYRGGLATASAATAAVLLSVVRGAGPVPALFGTAVMRWLGERSFSLYLWHWPAMVLISAVLARTPAREVPALPGLLALAVSLPAAHWSYRRVETPIRRRGYRAVAAELAAAAPRLRLGVPATGAALAAAAAVAIATAPQQTRLEADLAAAAAQRDRAEAAEDASVTEHREPPAGDRITAIGDSVLLATAEALREQWPGIYVDGAVSRHWDAVPPILEEMEAAGTLDPFVVLGFGTNGPAAGAGEDLLDRILDALGEDRVVVLVLPYGDRWYMPEAEAEVRAAAQARDNVYVADWCHAAKADRDRLRADLIHPTPPGAVAYVAAIRRALDQWVEDDKEIPGACGT